MWRAWGVSLRSRSPGARRGKLREGERAIGPFPTTIRSGGCDPRRVPPRFSGAGARSLTARAGGSRSGGAVPGRNVQLPDRSPAAPSRRRGPMDANLRFWRTEGQVGEPEGLRGDRAARAGCFQNNA